MVPHLNCDLLNLHTLIIHRLSINMAFQRNLCVTGENSASCRHAQSKESQTRPNAGGISLTGESTVWMDIRSTTEWLCCITDCHSTVCTEDGKAGAICQWSGSKFQGISWLVYLLYEQKWPNHPSANKDRPEATRRFRESSTTMTWDKLETRMKLQWHLISQPTGLWMRLERKQSWSRQQVMNVFTSLLFCHAWLIEPSSCCDF